MTLIAKPFMESAREMTTKSKSWVLIGGVSLVILEGYCNIFGSWQDLPPDNSKFHELDGWFVSLYCNLIDFYKDILGSAGVLVYVCVIMTVTGTFAIVSLSSNMKVTILNSLRKQWLNIINDAIPIHKFVGGQI